MINFYKTKADYEADMSKQQLESVVSNIKKGNGVFFNGVNVLTEDPRIGDIVCRDANNEVRFIACDTFKGWDAANQVGFPQDWTAIGVVASREGNEILVAHRSNAGKAWSAVFRWKVLGWESLTDGSANYAVTIKNVNIGNLTGLDGTYATFMNKYNTLVQSARQTGILTIQSHMYWDGTDNCIYLIWDDYNTWDFGTWSIQSITLTPWVGQEIPEISYNVRKNGIQVYWGGMNRARFYEYYSVNGTGDPGSAVMSFNTNVYSKAAFEAQAAYPGSIYYQCDGSYDKFIDLNMVEAPFGRGIMSPEFMSGKWNCDQLGNKQYKDIDGNNQYMYPAIRYAVTTGYAGVKGFDVGDWYLPSMYEMAPVWNLLSYGLSGVTQRNSDPINRSLYAIGGSAIPVSSYAWSSSRYSSYNAWHYDVYGRASYAYFYLYWLIAVPFARYTL
jgi:hypothetical protein